MNLHYSPFEYKKGLEDYLELFKNAFPEVTDNSGDAYFWQMHSYPNEKTHSYEYSAHIDNLMVGYYAAIPYRYNIKNETVDVGMVCGVMTSSHYRGKGIFTKLGAYSLQNLKQNVSFTTGYPIRKEVIPGHLKVGWKIAFQLPLYMKFVRTNSLFRTKAKFLLFLAPVANIILRIIFFLIKTKIKNNQYHISVSNHISDFRKMEKFESNWVNSIPISLIRDEKFIKWRYGRPGASYKFITVQKEDEVIGFCSYRKIIKEGVPSFGIMDLRVLDNNVVVLSNIFYSLEQQAKKENVDALMLMISKSYAKKYNLRKNGYLKSPYKFSLIINNLQQRFNDNFLYDESNWHLMWVDSDDL
jgi:hypothetical protein